jgi:hypothetical protein
VPTLLPKLLPLLAIFIPSQATTISSQNSKTAGTAACAQYFPYGVEEPASPGRWMSSSVFVLDSFFYLLVNLLSIASLTHEVRGIVFGFDKPLLAIDVVDSLRLVRLRVPEDT